MKKVIPLVAALSTSVLSHASLLVYEGFEYGGSSVDLHGFAASGSGTQGSWNVSNVLPGGGQASSVYQSTGLEFGGNFATTKGGAVLMTAQYSGSDASSTATLRLNTTASGTVWSSFLVNYSTLGLASSGYAQQSLTTSTDSASFIANSKLGSRVATNALATDRKTVAIYEGGTTTNSSAPTLTTGVTYLVISKFTNVGTALSAGSPGVATNWYLTQTDFDSWFTDGGQLESALDSYAFKKQTDTQTSGTFSLDENSYLGLRSDAPNQNGFVTAATFDEIRYGTDLASVYAAIPEPSTCAGIAGAIMLGAAVGRRRANRRSA